MDGEQWRQVRDLFDAVCDYPADQWLAELQRRTSDPVVLQHTLELLEAQTLHLSRVVAPLGSVIAKATGPELQVGDVLGQWRLTERLAGGGMGAVFVAQRADDIFQQRVAIKLLAGLPDARFAERLATERRILASLQHPNVARLYDGGSTPAGQPYLVMEYIEGEPLDAYVQRHQPGLQARLALFQKLCAAVQWAHERLVVHCDLKPGNVLVTPAGEPVLLDFGIARLLDGAGGSERTEFCTPAYASPELIAGQPVGAGSDVFSLGVMLAELLAGKALGRTLADQAVPVPAPSAFAPTQLPWRRKLRGDLDAIVQRACALDPDQRYGSVVLLGADIDRYLAHRPVAARSAAGWYPLARGLRRHWKAAAVAAAAVLMSGSFVWNLEQARKVAEEESLVSREISEFLVASFQAADPRAKGEAAREATAREVLDAGAEQIERQMANAPVQRARLQRVLGRAYQNIGQPQPAERLLRLAANTLADPGLGQPLLAADTHSDLSVLVSNDIHGDEAEQLARRALQLLDGQPELSGSRAKAYNALGLALNRQQRFDEAEQAFKRAIDIRTRLKGTPQAGSMTDVRHNLAMLYRDRGDLDQAEALFRESLQAYRDEAGEGAGYQQALHSLGMTVLEQGRHAEAAELFRQSLELSLRLYGEDSANTARAYAELAGAYLDLGDYRKSRPAYLRALALLERAEGSSGASLLMQLNNLGTLEEARGNVAEAERLFRKAWLARRDALGPEARGTLISESNLGRLLMRNGRWQEAQPLIERPLQLWSAKLPPSAPDFRISSMGHAEWQMRRGALAAARRELQQLPLDDSWKGNIRARRLLLEAELAKFEGRLDVALDYQQQALANATRANGADGIQAARLRLGLAEILLARGEREAAAAQLRPIREVMRAQLDPASPLLAKLQQLLEATS